MKKLFFILFLSLTFLTLSYSKFIKRDKGFTPHKISPTCASSSYWNVPNTPVQLQDVKTIFDQSFKYLGSGKNFYAFVSNDEKYVIKFFKQNHMRLRGFIDHFPLPSSIKSRRKQRANNHKNFRKKVFKSCLIALKDLPEETGVFYVHLNKTYFLNKTTQFIDQYGKKHKFNLDEMEFVLQKKANLIFPSITNWMRAGREDLAKTSISNILSLIIKRCKKRIIDDDVNCNQNLGLIGTKALEIDLGDFHYAPSDYQYDYLRELISGTTDLDIWLKKNHPSLAVFLKNEREQQAKNVGEMKFE